MANNMPNRSLDITKVSNFSDAVKWYLKEKRMTQADLIRKSGVSRSTIYKIYHNKDGRGGPYKATDEIIYAISNAFELSPDKWRELKSIAFPERKIWEDGLKNRINIVQVNIDLYDNGCDLLPITKEN